MERAGLAVQPRSAEPQDRPDYIGFGTPAHAAFLGLILLADGERTPQGQRHTFMSETTGQIYCLEDELGSLRFYPGLSLDEVVPVVLRQKVSAYESGEPKVPERAPAMWTPEPVF